MKLIINPKDSITIKEYNCINNIAYTAEKILQKNGFLIPDKIYFYYSFDLFIKKVLSEVQNYGFNCKEAEEIIKCSLNNGTYGTINYDENAVIEMNFNPFNKGEYKSLDFLAMIIHESAHLHLSKKMKKDINNMKFRFEKNKFIGNEMITFIDEGYASFMTEYLLKGFKVNNIKNIKIPIMSSIPPNYAENINDINIKIFDSNFEKLVVLNRDKGYAFFKEKFGGKIKIDEVTEFAIKELKNLV